MKETNKNYNNNITWIGKVQSEKNSVYLAVIISPGKIIPQPFAVMDFGEYI
jgi:hypothetical protein